MCLVNIKGELVEKTPDKYPYSYEAFMKWKKDYQRTDEVVYSDRLISWDYDKYNKCSKAIWGNTRQTFDMRLPKQIEAFLSMYFNKCIILTGIEQCCNVSSGYPIWIFYYRENEVIEDVKY